jgi:hypothetical protein
MVVKVLRPQGFLLLMGLLLWLYLRQTLIQERLYSRKQPSWIIVLAFILTSDTLVSVV